MKIILIFSLLSTTLLFAAKPWQGAAPPITQNSKKWVQLTEQMHSNEMFFGELAAFHHMLIFFTDLETKQTAYANIIKLIDLGYTFPTQHLFSMGDIEPTTEDSHFSNSYYLHKALITQNSGVSKWVDFYFSKVDKENFEKYLFYQAIQQYQKKDLKASKELLKKILSKKMGLNQKSLVKKVARTLARVYFANEEYEKSRDIYESFLLNTDPVIPADWIETAWNLYYLHRFDQALGVLYNLESKSADKELSLEKYVIRSLIYREFCATDKMEMLLQNFDQEFGGTINAIKSGEPLGNLPALKNIPTPEGVHFQETSTILEALKYESKNIKSLSSDLQPLARYLYDSEINLVSKRLKDGMEVTVENAAKNLVMMTWLN